MKIRIELEENLKEEEIIIKCSEINKRIKEIENLIKNSAKVSNIKLYKRNAEYYIPIERIIFFETSENGVEAHTKDEIYRTKNRLYELEEALPCYYVRISKSAIINTNQVYSIDRTMGSSACISFNKTPKSVYSSRKYYKNLINKLENRS